jgi:DinB superfamily
MKEAFKVWENSRKVYLNFLEKYSTEQLHFIPEGLSNNLLWNIGHIVVVQQALVYKLSGLPMLVTDELFDKYRNGSQPNTSTSTEEIETIKQVLTEAVAKTKSDYENKLFQNYNEFTTTTGFNLATIEDAITFNNYHEGMHLGFMLKIKKFL